MTEQNKQLTFSVSELKTFKDCRLKHHLMYREGWQSKQIYKPFFVGIIIHDALESYYGEGVPLEQAAQQAVKKNLDIWQGKITLEDMYNQSDEMFKTTDLIYNMLKHYMMWLSTQEEYQTPYADSRFEFISSEHDLEVMVDNILIRLRVDGILRDKETGEYFIHEIKTTSNFSGFDSNLYRDLQPTVYAKAVSKHLGIDVQGIVYTVLKKKVPSVETLKNGDYSTATSRDMTPEWFAYTVTSEFDEEDGEDLLAHKYAKYMYYLKTEKGFSFFNRFTEYRSEDEWQMFLEDNLETIKEMNGDYFPTSSDNMSCDNCPFKIYCYNRITDRSFDHLEFLTEHFELKVKK